MGSVYAKITVTKTSDMAKARGGYIAEKDIRSITFNDLVDTGATTLIINEELSRQLGFFIMEERTANPASGMKDSCKITEPVQIQWKDRYANVSTVVFPIVDPVHRELVGAHGDKAILMAM